MPRIAVVPGSFDPVTRGHLDVVERAALLADVVHVVVVHNPDKKALLPPDERIELLRASIGELSVKSEIVVATWNEGLLVDYCRRVGAEILVKGLRSQTDIAYEMPMALVNRDLAGVETVFVVADPAHAHVSSSLVRQVASLGGDVRPYVPAVVAARLEAR